MDRDKITAFGTAGADFFASFSQAWGEGRADEVFYGRRGADLMDFGTWSSARAHETKSYATRVDPNQKSFFGGWGDDQAQVTIALSAPGQIRHTTPAGLLDTLTYDGGPGYDYFMLTYDLDRPAGTALDLTIDLSLLGGTFQDVERHVLFVSGTVDKDASVQARVLGTAGTDWVLPNPGFVTYTLDLGAGDDLAKVHGRAAQIRLGAGDDQAQASGTIHGGGGNDRIITAAYAEGVSHVFAGPGDDQVFVNGAVELRMGKGDDIVVLGTGATGRLDGGKGDDLLSMVTDYRGDPGGVTMTGGEGADRFAVEWDRWLPNGVATITDFTSGTDRLILPPEQERWDLTFIDSIGDLVQDEAIQILRGASQVYVHGDVIADLTGAEITLDDIEFSRVEDMQGTVIDPDGQAVF